MKPIDIHRAWAPDDGAWSAWVKPVLFAALQRDETLGGSSEEKLDASTPEWFVAEVLTPLEERAPDASPYRSGRSSDDTAIVIDLPSREGVELGIALGEHGFRPIPLYNALPSRVAIVDVQPIVEGLARGAEVVAKISRSALPAFLLDARRAGQGQVVRPGLFDNRSTCWSSDFPSAERFRQAGIRRVVLVCDTLAEDLEAIALDWQSAGLEIWWKRTADGEQAAPTTLRRPWLGRRLYNLVFGAGFLPGANGAYGKLIKASTTA